MDDLRNHINKLREDFSHGELNEKDVHHDPSQQFSKWLHQAIETKVPEAQAMQLATVSESGRPSSRIVYLREFHNNQYWFYTNYNSKKVKELDLNSQSCITFFWPQIERQIRIEGTVTRATEKESDDYFNSRPYESKIGAWASAQSNTLLSREELENKVEELKKLNTPEEIKRPPHWGGLILSADYYEFWQGRKSRLHDRICYQLKNNNWELSRIAP